MTVDPTRKFVYVANESGTVPVFSLGSGGQLTAGEPAPNGALAVAVVSSKR
ncbi:MAG: hypothetical protein WCB05_20205 [Candidatus Sulfotelmatobacter sp.]